MIIHLPICLSTYQLNIDLDETLRRFWAIEETPETNVLSQEDIDCEEHFVKTHKRQEDARYVVKLPFKASSEKLGYSSIIAMQRFLVLERNLSKNEELKKQYVEQTREYLETGHLVEINTNQYNYTEENTYYLPHHPRVQRPNFV